MRMEIETYNGIRGRIPRSWRDRYEFKSHDIGVSFPSGEVRVRDLPRR
jgi:hypothetical protein